MLLLGVFSCASVTDCTQQAVPTAWGRASWPSVLRRALLSLLQCGDIHPMGAMAKPAVLFKLDTKTKPQNTMSRVGQHWPCLEVHQLSTCSWVQGSWGTAGALGVGSAPSAAAGTWQYPHGSWACVCLAGSLRGTGKSWKKLSARRDTRRLTR